MEVNSHYPNQASYKYYEDFYSDRDIEAEFAAAVGDVASELLTCNNEWRGELHEHKSGQQMLSPHVETKTNWQLDN